MSALTDFFEVGGIVINDIVAIAAGINDPTIILLDLPVGSLYIRTTGELWTKYGALSNEWKLVNITDTQSLEELIVYNNLGDPELLFMNDTIVKVSI